MSMMESLAGLGHDVGSHRVGEPLASVVAGFLETAQGLAVDEFHHHVGLVLISAEVRDLNQVGMVESSGEAGLVEQHGLKLGVAREFGMNLFDGDEAFKTVLAAKSSEVHRGHSPFAQRQQELVATEAPAGQAYRFSDVVGLVIHGEDLTVANVLGWNVPA
jgi:hypothetical protein